jgi:hypothetical protein
MHVRRFEDHGVAGSWSIRGAGPCCFAMQVFKRRLAPAWARMGLRQSARERQTFATSNPASAVMIVGGASTRFPIAASQAGCFVEAGLTVTRCSAEIARDQHRSVPARVETRVPKGLAVTISG